MTVLTHDNAEAPAPDDLEGQQSHFRQMSSAMEGSSVSLEWTNLTFKAGDKTILNNCSGILRPGELTAVLGPSGSGKSTLMNVIGGRQALSGGGKSFEGEVSFAGEVMPPVDFRSQIAYVMQDDSLMPTSTPREVLEFSAKLRLGSNKQTSADEVSSLVTELIDALRLTNCADTVVGDDLIKGISGGERKRASVGTELITNPKMIFLDEPLSGLDSFAAHTTVKVLKDLARSGVPVMVTVHQPSSEIYSLFDNILVIAQGNVVYHGPCDEILSFFAEHGFECPPNYNPTDFVLFVLQTEPQEKIQHLIDAHHAHIESVVLPEIVSIRKCAEHTGNSMGKLKRVGVATQMRELLIREIRDTKRNPAVLMMRYAILVTIGLMFALVFYQVGESQPELYWLTNLDKFQSYYGAIVSVNMAAMMGSAQATVLRYPSQRGIFLREYATNMYSSVPYVVAKTIVELPLSFVDSLVQMIISYWFMNLQGNFALWVLTLWFVNVTASSLAQLMGAAVNSAAQAMQLLPLMFVPQVLFSGLFTSLSNIPEWLRWLQYLCFLKYGINLAYLLEFGSDYTQLNEMNDVKPDLTGLYVGLMFVMIFVFRTAAVLLLKRKAKFVF